MFRMPGQCDYHSEHEKKAQHMHLQQGFHIPPPCYLRKISTTRHAENACRGVTVSVEISESPVRSGYFPFLALTETVTG
jgi:hypothetical protein